MISIAAKFSRRARAWSSFSLLRPPPPPLPLPLQPLLPAAAPIPLSPSTRLFSASNKCNGFKPNPVVLQMINYALSLARSHKSGSSVIKDESYSQALLVLEQCYSTQSDDNSKGVVLLAMSTLLSERGKFGEAVEKLQSIEDLNVSSLAVRVAATEALVGLDLEVGQDDISSMLVDIALQLLVTIELELGIVSGLKALEARVKALKGLVEVVRGNVESESYFQAAESDEGCIGNVALSYGEFLHGMRNFAMAKEFYQKVIQGISENNDFGGPHNLAACNMIKEEVLLAATCALGQLEGHVGNFGDAEETLTTALKKVEEHFGSHHPKVGVILTCIALMYRHKATMECSSSFLIQEGLYRRALELLKAPPLETEGAEAKRLRSDIVALARGGYSEILCVQENRKAEGERLKHWAESAWRNRRLSLAEALELSESSSKVPVIDSRISRCL